MKEAISVFAVLLSFISYAPYLRDTIRGKTKPHVYTWFIWGFVTILIFALQLSDGAGTGAYVTLSAGILSFAVFFLSLKNGRKNITRSDTVFLTTALLATGLWFFAKQPVLSVVLLSAIDLLGLIPTIRKSWNKPGEETLFTWSLNSFRHGISIYSLQNYSFITLIYPVIWTVVNVAFSIMLVVRRRQLLPARTFEANS